MKQGYHLDRCPILRGHLCVAWYHKHHCHSALKFVTPGQRHRGEDQAWRARRRRLYEAAKGQHPERWRGAIRNWEPDTLVHLNPGKPGGV